MSSYQYADTDASEIVRRATANYLAVIQTELALKRELLEAGRQQRLQQQKKEEEEEEEERQTLVGSLSQTFRQHTVSAVITSLVAILAVPGTWYVYIGLDRCSPIFWALAWFDRALSPRIHAGNLMFQLLSSPFVSLPLVIGWLAVYLLYALTMLCFVATLTVWSSIITWTVLLHYTSSTASTDKTRQAGLPEKLAANLDDATETLLGVYWLTLKNYTSDTIYGRDEVRHEQEMQNFYAALGG